MSIRFKHLRALRASGYKGLIPFITAGDLPHEATVRLMRQLTAAGASAIELGVPFSDPMADGPTIQRASERALRHGTTLKDVLQIVTDFRKTDDKTPIVLMGYFNPILRYGLAPFARDAENAGVDGVLIVDCPPEEAAHSCARDVFTAAGIDMIYLVAPTTPEDRVRMIADNASGFIYVVSLKGVTGSKALDTQAVADHVRQLRAVTSLPVAVGFGIKTPEAAVAVAKIADAVVIGSRLIELIEASGNGADPSEAVQWFASVRKALDRIEDAR